MISLVRVDDRLVHGQITVGWVPYLRATQLLVVNDRLAADMVLAGIVKAGGTASLKIKVVGTERAARLCRQGAFDGERLIVLFESLEDARRALDAGLHFRYLNLGGLRHDGGKSSVKGAISLTKTDLEVLRDLRHRGIEVEVRLMPRDRPRLIPAGICEEGH